MNRARLAENLFWESTSAALAQKFLKAIANGCQIAVNVTRDLVAEEQYKEAVPQMRRWKVHELLFTAANREKDVEASWVKNTNGTHASLELQFGKVVSEFDWDIGRTRDLRYRDNNYFRNSQLCLFQEDEEAGEKIYAIVQYGAPAWNKPVNTIKALVFDGGGDLVTSIDLMKEMGMTISSKWEIHFEPRAQRRPHLFLPKEHKEDGSGAS